MNIIETGIGSRSLIICANAKPDHLLIHPADANELPSVAAEAELIAERSNARFALCAFSVLDWDSELSPWEAPPVFGNRPFGNGAGKTLEFIEKELLPHCVSLTGAEENVNAVIGGYSLAALFALYCGYTSERFKAVAAASPSVWLPGWIEFADSRTPKADIFRLSLGNREEKTKNRVMSTVGGNILRQLALLEERGKDAELEWNEGGHFSDPIKRTAKAFAHAMNALEGRNTPKGE